MTNKRILNTLFGTHHIASILPGTALAVAVMLFSLFLADLLGSFFQSQFHLSKSPVSTFLLAILIGMIVRNVIHWPAIFLPGITFCVAKLLRLGIMFLGIRLSILAVAKIGAVAVLVVVFCIASGIAISLLFARIFGVADRLGTLIAAGTGICGVSAIIATSPAIGAKEEETTYAVSTITIFGLIATIAYPYLVELILGLDLGQAGLFLGTAVHDTAQVTGAAYIYDQLWAKEVSQIAITTKLVRNTFLMVVVPLCAVLYARGRPSSGPDEPKKINVMTLFPVFVLGFLGFALFRSLGDVFISKEGGFLLWRTADEWHVLTGMVANMAKYVLAVAIAGAGLSTEFAKLKRLTMKPFFIGLLAAVTVGCVSYLLVTLFQGSIQNLIQY